MVDIKIITICVLTVILGFLLMKKSEYLVSENLTLDSLINVTPFSNTSAASFGFLIMVGFVGNELSKNPVYPSANDLLKILGPTGNEYTTYTSDTQIEQLFETAYTQGESGLPEKDRVLLRALALYSTAMLNGYTPGTIDYTSGGLPHYASTVISESGKSTREFLYNVLFASKDTLNNILPQGYSKYNDTDDIYNDTDTNRKAWVMNALTIPWAYIAWLAKNKWNLSMTWKSPYCSSGSPPTPTRIISRPSGTSYGPGTYTKSQLGNPTSIDIYAPIKVQITRGVGTSSFTLNKRLGCIYSPDQTLTELDNLSTVVVSIPEA
jgi:hypothetical protein